MAASHAGYAWFDPCLVRHALYVPRLDKHKQKVHWNKQMYITFEYFEPLQSECLQSCMAPCLMDACASMGCTSSDITHQIRGLMWSIVAGMPNTGSSVIMVSGEGGLGGWGGACFACSSDPVAESPRIARQVAKHSNEISRSLNLIILNSVVPVSIPCFSYIWQQLI